MGDSEIQSEPYQISKTEGFAKTVSKLNCFKRLSNVKYSISAKEENVAHILTL